VNKESVASLKDRLESAMAPFTRKGIPFKTLVEQACCCRPADWARSAVSGGRTRTAAAGRPFRLHQKQIPLTD